MFITFFLLILFLISFQLAYAPCHCGSGKKFKWCCQPIYPGIQRALEQDEAGQHDAALRIMDEVVKANETNPEAWGQKARLQYMQGKVDEAEGRAEALGLGANPKTLEDEIAELRASDRVDAELAALKARLNKGE